MPDFFLQIWFGFGWINVALEVHKGYWRGPRNLDPRWSDDSFCRTIITCWNFVAEHWKIFCFWVAGCLQVPKILKIYRNRKTTTEIKKWIPKIAIFAMIDFKFSIWQPIQKFWKFLIFVKFGFTDLRYFVNFPIFEDSWFADPYLWRYMIFQKIRDTLISEIFQFPKDTQFSDLW